MEDEDLIKLVRQHEVLYNWKHKRYTDNAAKEEVWKRIGAELNRTGPRCKAKWRSIRDQFRRHLRKKALNESSHKPRFRLAEEMAFVMPYLRERTGSDPIRVDEEANFGDMEEMEEDIKLEKKFEVFEEEDVSLTEEMLQFNAKSMECSVDAPTEEVTGFLEKKYKVLEDEDISLSKEMLQSDVESSECSVDVTPERVTKCPIQTSTSEKTIGNNSSPNQQMSHNAPSKESSEELASEKDSTLDLYFQMVAATVKKFSPYYQSVFKSRVFSILSELEMEQLMKEGRTPTSSSVAERN